MKISLFIKPSVAKACFSFFIFIYILAQPGHASASFFSDLLTQVLGSKTQASEVAPIEQEVIHNSQNIPLLESSINPDLKNIKDEPAPTSVNPNPVALSNDGSLGNDDSELEKYASSVKISTYTVKKGDTLDSISKKLNVPKSTIISSNADLKKSDLLKIGQTLVILALKDQPAEKVDKSTQKDSTKDEKTKKPLEDKVIVKKEEPIKEEKPKDESPKITTNTDLPPPQNQNQIINTPPPAQIIQQQPPETIITAPTPTESGQPSGTINGGYIWPFPQGVGRVSQGRHADNAFDFSAPKGTPIYAVQSGTVLIAHPTGYNGGYGLYVVINFDDGRQAIFGHMSKVAVEAGQVVKQGDIIGYVGSTGKSTGPHAHIGFHGDLPNPYLGLKVGNTNIDHD